MQFSENDQTKPDLFSRLACSTKLSKILEDDPPKRYPFGSRPGVLHQVVLELVALTDSAYSASSAFLRELFNFTELSSSCQL
jgi:hypothetical protein